MSSNKLHACESQGRKCWHKNSSRRDWKNLRGYQYYAKSVSSKGRRKTR